jgi:hypothetical protein
VGVKTLFIEPGSRWENGYVESFNGILRDEFLDGKIFYNVTRGQDFDRAVAGALQPGAPAFGLGIPAAGPGGDLACWGLLRNALQPQQADADMN